jgi:endonuclease/exonuclease/phosphatase family metal-dependent hydrolase
MVPGPDPSTELAVATLNIAGLPSTLPPLRVRAVELGRWFEASTIDVVALQEVWTRDQLAVLRRELPSFRYVAWRHGLATLSRLPIRSVTSFSYRAARARSGGVLFRARMLVNTHLQGVLVVTLDEGVVGNTHLTANRDGDWSAGNRYETLQRTQLELLHGFLRRYDAPGPVVVCGDFNVSSRSVLYRWIVDGGAWHDPFAEADPPTYHQSMLPPGRESHRIDYLLVAGPYPVVDTALLFPEPGLSDHVGLGARIALSLRPPAPR